MLWLCVVRAERRTLDVPKETVVVFSLDAGPSLEEHAFSTVAALSSIVHFSNNPSKLRFFVMQTMPTEATTGIARAMCRAVDAAVGNVFPERITCVSRSLANTAAWNATGCAASTQSPTARITFVELPPQADVYPPEIRSVLELLCCSQRRYSIKRAELATSIGNHARFFAYLALLPLGVKRAVFLDADVLARVDVAPLYETLLTPARFIAAARRCASKRAAYKPHFKFNDELVKEYGLKSNSMLVNAGVLVMDLEAYCQAGILDALKNVLRRHIQGPPLWQDGNNQPPFTIAAARHFTFIDPSWNVRIGDAKAQAMVTQARKRRHERLDRDECSDIIENPRILHAHFNPCRALPSRLCPTGSDGGGGGHNSTLDPAKHLK